MFNTKAAKIAPISGSPNVTIFVLPCGKLYRYEELSPEIYVGYKLIEEDNKPNSNYLTMPRLKDKNIKYVYFVTRTTTTLRLFVQTKCNKIYVIKKAGTTRVCVGPIKGLPTLPSESIVQISAYRDNVLFLTQNGEVFACGDNKYEQCGAKNVKNIVPLPYPKKILFPCGIQIRKVLAHNGINIFVANNGCIYSYVKFNQVMSPNACRTFTKTKFKNKIISVESLGRDRLLFLEETGDVYVINLNTLNRKRIQLKFPQNVHITKMQSFSCSAFFKSTHNKWYYVTITSPITIATIKISTPYLLSRLIENNTKEIKIIDIYPGYGCAFAVTENGDVYAYSNNQDRFGTEGYKYHNPVKLPNIEVEPSTTDKIKSKLGMKWNRARKEKRFIDCKIKTE